MRENSRLFRRCCYEKFLKNNGEIYEKNSKINTCNFDNVSFRTSFYADAASEINSIEYANSEKLSSSGESTASIERIIRMFKPIISYMLMMPILTICFIIGLVKGIKKKSWKMLRNVIIIAIIYMIIDGTLSVIFDGWAININ